jgi:alpha-tubulin suppressor-like RCC1 family protein
MPPRVRAVFAWGEGEDGQLGIATLVKNPEDPDTEPHETCLCQPTWVPALQEVELKVREFGRSPVAGGSRGSVAIGKEGELYTWGWNKRGSLGLGHNECQYVPQKVAHLAHERIVQAAVGGWHTLALSDKEFVQATNSIQLNNMIVNPFH